MAKGFMDGYKTYDTSQGYGNARQWRSSFYKKISKEEAEKEFFDEPEGTPYEVLGVTRQSTPQEIKAAFRKLIMFWHPDKNSDPRAEEMSKRITAAYTLIK